MFFVFKSLCDPVAAPSCLIGQCKFSLFSIEKIAHLIFPAGSVIFQFHLYGSPTKHKSYGTARIDEYRRLFVVKINSSAIL